MIIRKLFASNKAPLWICCIFILIDWFSIAYIFKRQEEMYFTNPSKTTLKFEVNKLIKVSDLEKMLPIKNVLALVPHFSAFSVRLGETKVTIYGSVWGDRSDFDSPVKLTEQDFDAESEDFREWIMLDAVTATTNKVVIGDEITIRFKSSDGNDFSEKFLVKDSIFRSDMGASLYMRFRKMQELIQKKENNKNALKFHQFEAVVDTVLNIGVAMNRIEAVSGVKSIDEPFELSKRVYSAMNQLDVRNNYKKFQYISYCFLLVLALIYIWYQSKKRG